MVFEEEKKQTWNQHVFSVVVVVLVVRVFCCLACSRVRLLYSTERENVHHAIVSCHYLVIIQCEGDILLRNYGGGGGGGGSSYYY